MITIANGLADADANLEKDNPQVNAVTTPVSSATLPSEPTFTVTESELRDIVAAAAARTVGSQVATPTPAGQCPVAAPGQTTKPEECTAHRLFTRLERATSKVIAGTRERVVVPGNLYLVDRAVPQAMAIVAAGSAKAALGASKASSYFAHLAERAAAKARR